MIDILVGFSDNQKDLIKDIAKKCFDIGIEARENNLKIKEKK